ncbi:ABC transporter substrate-binding protein, partial [Klebsiella variicola]|uniref:ABC transporter substrate-binding protein n=1 Tax=Klebsiella variicola TaxID=244366 RepID=UPI0039C37302
AKFAELAKIAPTIDLTGNAKDYLGSVENNVKTLGRIFGKQQEADKAVAELDSAVSALKAKAASKGQGLIVLTTGGRISA